MAAMTESCSVCGGRFDVQFRYQMEERDGGFAFYCSQDCHGQAVRGETTGGATCSACNKRFRVELVSQVVRVRGELRHACSDECRAQVLAEASGARLGAATAPEKQGAGPRRLAVFNHKGGTGKTTTSVSLAAGMAACGLRVLLVDTDSQGNVSVSLGVKADKTLYHVLVMGTRPEAAVVRVRPNLDLIASNETLAAAELYLAGRQNRDRVLCDRLAPAFAGYDVVVLDCSPSLSLMNQNALVAVDGIIVPVACDFLSLVGVRQVVKTVKNVNALLHHPVQIEGVLPTFYDARARICRDAVDALKDHFGDRVLPPIRSAIRLKEATAQGKTIFEFAPDSHPARDYQQVVDLLVAGVPAAQQRAVG